MTQAPKNLAESTDLVFLHGWGMNQGIWQPFSKRLQQAINDSAHLSHIKVSAIDLPGYGLEHNASLNDYSIESVSAWLATKLSKPSIVVGWSMGGLIAQYLASNQHPAVIGHIQIASSPCFVEQADWPGIKPNVLAIFAKQLKIDHEVLLKRFLALQNMGLNKPKFSVNTMLSLITQYPKSSQSALEKSLALLQSTDLRASLANIEVPCLRIYGRLDGLVPTKAAGKIKALSVNSQSVVIEHASHAPFLSHPESCLNAILPFLEQKFGLSS